MPSTYTTNGGIELPANGEQSGTWGETVNDNMAIIDRLTNGVGAVSLSGTTHTLTTTDGTLSDGQYNVLVLGGSPSGTNTITISPNDGEHVYVVKNASGQTATFTQGSGANVSVLNNTTKIIYADGAGAGAAVVDITGALDLGSLIIAGTSVTATAAELNILDGVTATAAELNILDGVTATAAELNILDGVTATAAELNYNDITTLGTVQASKTVTANASGDVLFPDGDKAIFGAGSDLQIYHDPAAGSIIQEGGSGSLFIRASTNIQLEGVNGENMAIFNENGSVQLYYDNSEKLATTATGISVTGTVAADGLTVAGASILGAPATFYVGDDGSPNGAFLNQIAGLPLRFLTSGTERMRIDSSGSVGIGTSSPRQYFALHVTQSQNTGSGIVSENTSTGVSASAFVKYQNSGITSAFSGLSGVNRSVYATLGPNVMVGSYTDGTAGITHLVDAAGPMTFATNSVERMRIDSSGNLLVGRRLVLLKLLVLVLITQAELSLQQMEMMLQY
jgi:hypothetical protein